MKKSYFYLSTIIAVVFLVGYTNNAVNPADGMVSGTPDLQSISAITFGDNGMLFIGDSRMATIFAIDTQDAKPNQKAAAVNMENIHEKIAASLGSPKENVTITDMAVNPISRKLYISVQHSDGSPAILKIENDKIQPLSLKDIRYSQIALNDVVEADAKDQRGRPLLEESLQILNDEGAPVKGSFMINQEEKTVDFIPLEPWIEGNYMLVVQSILEDLAGNNLNRVFDRDITKNKACSAELAYSVKFRIGRQHGSSGRMVP